MCIKSDNKSFEAFFCKKGIDIKEKLDIIKSRKEQSFMEYYAHKTEGREQTVKEHLEQTAELAKENAVEPFKSLAYECGLLHDVGKYTKSFQRRINGENVKCEHSICGAQWVKDNFRNDPFAFLMEYCIAGHHTGLPDGGSRVDKDKPTLQARLKSKTDDYSYFLKEISPERPDSKALLGLLAASKDGDDRLEKYSFFTRYIFSCLTDADFINTESVFSPQTKRGIEGDFKAALEKLDKKLSDFKADTRVNAARKNLLEQAVENSNDLDEINILNMPTGSGKTLCSMKIALEYAVKEHKKRIIYVIPYTSIIEQTADIFSGIFGEDLFVLQHHSNFDYEMQKDDNITTADKLKRTCENWDAPLIVTTSVQFFQSIYHYKSSRLRKLHNMADSVIVFDEIHLMPIDLLQPCLRGIGYITKYLNSNAIFLSATMPDYFPLFNAFLPENKVKELISDKSDFDCFSNCSYNNLGKTSFERIAEKANDYISSLIIVNKRKSAQDIYKMLSGKRFHLSTYMTPSHRSKVIEQIRAALKNNEKITVVSTSLVEAGVDLDFEAVFRELAGLDSILQSGGRCNREGRRENGEVFVFESEEKLQGGLDMKANISREMLTKYDSICSEKAVEDYYGRIFKFSDEQIKAYSIVKIRDKDGNQATDAMSLPLRSFAESFKYIKDDTIGIVVDNCKEAHKLIEAIDNGSLSAKRRLQRYSVAVRANSEFNEMLGNGLIEKHRDVFVLTSNDYYDDEVGLLKEHGDIIV